MTQRERRWLRWSLLGATLALGFAYATNLNHLEFCSCGPVTIGFGLGGVSAGWRVTPGSNLWSLVPPRRWWLEFRQVPNGAWRLFVPLWAVVAPLAIATALAFWRSRRIERSGCCGECGYDRTGLKAGAACPECGTAAKDAPP